MTNEKRAELQSGSIEQCEAYIASFDKPVQDARAEQREAHGILDVLVERERRRELKSRPIDFPAPQHIGDPKEKK